MCGIVVLINSGFVLYLEIISNPIGSVERKMAKQFGFLIIKI